MPLQTSVELLMEGWYVRLTTVPNHGLQVANQNKATTFWSFILCCMELLDSYQSKHSFTTHYIHPSIVLPTSTTDIYKIMYHAQQ